MIKVAHTIALSAALAAATGAAAQGVDIKTLPPTQALDSPPGDTLFGDWGGWRNDLARQGINLKFDAVTEFAGNTSGGTRQGATFANQS